MNQTSSGYSKCFSILLIMVAFLISTQTPLWASPPQSSSTQSNQPSIVEQKQSDSLPDAPQAQDPAIQQPSTPSGAAGAKAANAKGAPVAQPAGAAVAPPRQRGHRSLLIKVGLIAGAAVAIGTAVALSEKSPARPPGATPAARP